VLKRHPQVIENGGTAISGKDDQIGQKPRVSRRQRKAGCAGKAKAHESALITQETTLGGLARFATARGGKYQGELNMNKSEWEFSIERK
jgi:hypothetical protein